MNLKMLTNDFKRNRAGNGALLIFMILASALVAVAVMVASQLIISMTEMYETAKPPHFLQMHKGEINQEAIDKFNSSYEGVTSWQTVSMIDVYGDDLRVYGEDEFTLSDCRLDISLVKQNSTYDLLLDKDRNAINVNKGEIGIPVILLDAYRINTGDTVVLKNNGVTRKFTVTAFVHDAQMNSTLCSSTRMLISDEDFKELFGKAGESEYLIETYFTDSSMAEDYRTAYEEAGLPQDGQAVTYKVIFLLSALRDIMMAMVLILISVLLVLVALMCIKYTLMAALEEEIGEIGTMKAIGMSFKDIRSLYLKKYSAMVAAGAATGYVLALITSGVFTEHVNETFGRQLFSVFTAAITAAACLLVYFITGSYVRKILSVLKSVTVVDALVNQKGFGKKERVRDGLHKSKFMPVNLLLGAREILHNFKGFALVFMVMFIVSGIMIVPVNLLNTMMSREFITYMGSPEDDMLVEIEQGENLEKRYAQIRKLLKDDTDIMEIKELRRVCVKTTDSEGQRMNLHVDSGNTAGKELKYLEGRAPAAENEIALSKLNADAMVKGSGDTITLSFIGKQMVFMVSGVYQDVTSGGFTSKAVYGFAGVDAEKFQFTINLAGGTDAEEKASQLRTKLGKGYDIEPMEEFINQTLGGVARQVEVAVTAAAAIGLMLSGLIVVLYMKLRLAKDASQITAQKAIGFTDNDVRKQYLYKIVIVSAAGIFAGTIISNIIGESIVSAFFSMMGLGISQISFIINPLLSFVLIPLVLLVSSLGMTWLSSRQIREYNVINLINE